MRSLWQAECEFTNHEPLKENLNVDVAVIGAGLAGVLTAYLLQERGFNVAVLERERIGEGETGRTTAKITAQHGIIYDKLIKQYGIELARKYAEANLKAIKQYECLVKRLKIDCNFKHAPAYIYSTGNTDKLEDEAAAAARLGIPSFMTDKTELPFKVTGALVFSNQARFHPLLFLKAIASKLKIYENTRVKAVEGNTVYFDGGTVNAKFVIVATHYPIINFPGLYFLRMHQTRSYVLGLQKVPEMEGMYLDVRDYGLSFRSEGDTLLFGGAGHRSGKNPASSSDTLERFEVLRRNAKKYYPTAEVCYQWSAQDCMTADGIPYIGPYSSSTPHLLVATGFNKWGMTSSMVAANILADYISGIKNEYAQVFSPSRITAKTIAMNLAEEGVQAAIGLSSQAFHFPMKSLQNLKKGEGGIVEYKNKKVGAYKSENGDVYLVSTRCPHLGCELKWNPDEKSWDCPCHGSRFDFKGNWLNSPAVDRLPNKLIKNH
ncbi:MAG TPA: FAD-dependent oxidoreductase [Clostridiales bacterium]|nr:FAD-dependent oxidoreductase [Clostridiales bacterium]